LLIVSQTFSKILILSGAEVWAETIPAANNSKRNDDNALDSFFIYIYKALIAYRFRNRAAESVNREID
jgi:hypothetical protein